MHNEKENNKKNILKRGISSALASAVLVGGIHSSASAKNINSIEDEKDSLNGINPSETDKIESSISIQSNYAKEAKELYLRTVEANSFVVQFQEQTNLKWDEVVATGVAEFINGEYPTSMTYMRADAAEKEISKITGSIQMIISGNLYSETKEQDIVDLTNYIVSEEGKDLVSNAMTMARACVEASLIPASFIDPVTGKKVVTLEPSNEYLNMVKRMLIYERDIFNSHEFLDSEPNIIFLVSTIFEIVNNSIRYDLGVLNKDGEVLSEDTLAYTRYFKDKNNGTIYIPGWHPEVIVYFGYQIDEGKLIYTNVQVSEEEMYTMAGLVSLEESEQTNTKNEESNIVECGLSVKAREQINKAVNDLLDLSNTYGKKI